MSGTTKSGRSDTGVIVKPKSRETVYETGFPLLVYTTVARISRSIKPEKLSFTNIFREAVSNGFQSINQVSVAWPSKRAPCDKLNVAPVSLAQIVSKTLAPWAMPFVHAVPNLDCQSSPFKAAERSIPLRASSISVFSNSAIEIFGAVVVVVVTGKNTSKVRALDNDFAAPEGKVYVPVIPPAAIEPANKAPPGSRSSVSLKAAKLIEKSSLTSANSDSSATALNVEAPATLSNQS